MTSRGDNGDDSQLAKLMLKNQYYPLSDLQVDGSDDVMDSRKEAVNENPVKKPDAQLTETSRNVYFLIRCKIPCVIQTCKEHYPPIIKHLFPTNVKDFIV
jgi:hypothetical protein